MTQIADWMEATRSYRAEIKAAKYEEALAAGKKGKNGYTFGQKELAENIASAHAVEVLYATEEYGGVRNPAIGEGVWGWTPEGNKAADDAKAKEEAEVADLAAWLRTQTWSDFAVSLAKWHAEKGFLSPKQIASGSSMRAKIVARETKKVEEKVADDSDPIDLSDLPSGYYAVPGGETRLKIRVARPTKNSRWFGYIFVSDGAEYGQRKNYGRQAPEANYSGKIRDELKAVLADPHEALTAYGKLTGTCGSCGRMLEDENSIAAGIGPICARKW